MGLDGLWKPDLRGKIEQQIRDVALGHVTKAQVDSFLLSDFYFMYLFGQVHDMFYCSD